MLQRRIADRNIEEAGLKGSAFKFTPRGLIDEFVEAAYDMSTEFAGRQDVAVEALRGQKQRFGERVSAALGAPPRREAQDGFGEALLVALGKESLGQLGMGGEKIALEGGPCLVEPPELGGGESERSERFVALGRQRRVRLGLRGRGRSRRRRRVAGRRQHPGLSREGSQQRRHRGARAHQAKHQSANNSPTRAAFFLFLDVNYGAGYSNWAMLHLYFTQPFYEVAFVGEHADEKRKEFNQHYLPNKTVAGSTIESLLPLLKNRWHDNQTLIYICADKTCYEPVSEVVESLKYLCSPSCN